MSRANNLKLPLDEYNAFHDQGYAAADGAEDRNVDLDKARTDYNPYDSETPQHEAWQDGWDDYINTHKKD